MDIEKFFAKYGLHLFTSLVTIFIAIVGWVIKEYYSHRKSLDKDQNKAVNGLGERLNKTLDRLEKELKESRLETKADIKEVYKKVDEVINTLHKIETKIIVKGYEAELSRVKHLVLKENQ